jgi:dTDP-4-dehydrorhamnose 3,5-epimerase
MTFMGSFTSGNFTFHETEIKGVYIIDVKTYGDHRGYFMETYKEADFKAAGLEYTFVQDNQSSSTKGVLRGLHFQKTHPQAKLVRVIKGEVFDVCVDLRKGSETYGKWVGVLLSEGNHRQFMIPRGFAHGFVVVSDTAEFAYKCDDLYHPEDEGGLLWNDPDVGVKWPEVGDVILSEKDLKNPTLKECGMVFNI